MRTLGRRVLAIEADNAELDTLLADLVAATAPGLLTLHGVGVDTAAILLREGDVLLVTKLDRLARSIWPELGPSVGIVAAGLVLAAKAGNIGTNHLFEAMLLDRLIALALGWNALGWLVERPARGIWLAPPALGLASLVHPSLGMQLAMLIGVSLVAWGLRPGVSGVGWRTAMGGSVWLGIALAPGVVQTVAEYHGAKQQQAQRQSRQLEQITPQRREAGILEQGPPDDPQTVGQGNHPR